MAIKLGNTTASLYLGSTPVAAYLGSTQVYSAFSPTSISGLALWLEPSDAVVSSGDVTSWPARHGAFTATVEEGTPTYSATGIGGKPGVVFDGGSDMAIESAVLAGGLSTAFTMIGVVKPTASSNHVESVRWLCLGGEESGSLIHFLQLRPYNGTPQFSAGVGRWGISEVDLTSDITTINGVTAVMCLTYDGAGNAELFVNGVSEGTAGGLDSTYSGATMDGHVTLGTQARTNFRLIGNLGDCLIYSRVLTSGELAQVTAYLTAKYGI